MGAPKTNNFFTTEAKGLDIQKPSAVSGTGYPIAVARPPRLHTATGTNRIKSTFYSGFQGLAAAPSQCPPDSLA